VKVLRRKLDDMEKSYDVLLEEVKQMQMRVDGKDIAASQAAPGDAKTHEEKIQASRMTVGCFHGTNRLRAQKKNKKKD